ncbi:MAG: AzlC family ABC transporter permease [Minwuia sp.]|nr:AzlC family ABC transporter permease [Minwuia sp.]
MNHGSDTLGRSIMDGLRMTFGFALGAFTFGIVYGTAAHVQGMGDEQTLVLSFTAFAGAAQFAVLPFWNDPLPLLAIALSAGLVSTRNILMGLTLTPILRQMSPLHRLVGIWLLVDATWALTMRERHRADVGVLYLTCSLTLLVTWMAGVALGVSLPGVLDPVTQEALGYGGITFLFLILLMVARSRIGPVLPWLVAAAAAVAADHFLDPQFSLIIGVGAGALTGLILPERADG